MNKFLNIGFTQIVAVAFPVIAAIFLWATGLYEANNLTFDVNNLREYPKLETPFLYLSINGLAILFPFLLSFDRRVHFYKKWRYLFPAILLTGLVFLPWDVLFTKWQIWGFNPDYYYAPFRILGLPLGEWLFFVTVPYACVFIYECLNYYVKPDIFKPIAAPLTYLLVLIFLTVSIIHWGKFYTVTTCLLTASLLMYYIFAKKIHRLSRFYLAFFVSLIPFCIVNGILTGAITQSPIVVYNDLENLGIRLVTIPLDDVAYCLLLLLMNVSWFEYFRQADSQR